ncbi:MAG: aminotransferase class III-fold pyridoxal phosphate-dependent enzyme [bacterium]|nr:aminotransferase class III-fold pyridoxal phosphate-dependent enzyme [bacterium]
MNTRPSSPPTGACRSSRSAARASNLSPPTAPAGSTCSPASPSTSWATPTRAWWGAITAQAQRYIHLSNYFAQEPQVRSAELLLRHSGMARVFFANSGTEAMEGALKIARRGAPRVTVGPGQASATRSTAARWARCRSWIAPTTATASALSRRVLFAAVQRCRRAARRCGPGTAAVVLECVQGEGGVRPGSRPPSSPQVEGAARKRARLPHHRRRDPERRLPYRPFLAADHFDLQPDSSRWLSDRRRTAAGRHPRRRPGGRRAATRPARHHLRRQPGGLRGGHRRP